MLQNSFVGTSSQQRIPDSYLLQQNRRFIIDLRTFLITQNSTEQKNPIRYINDCRMFPPSSYRRNACDAIKEWLKSLEGSFDEILDELHNEFGRLVFKSSSDPRNPSNPYYTNPEILKQWLEKLGLTVDNKTLANNFNEKIIFVCTLSNDKEEQGIQFIAKFAPYDDIIKELWANLIPEACSSTFLALAKSGDKNLSLSGVLFTEYMGDTARDRMFTIIELIEESDNIDLKTSQITKLVHLIHKMFIVLCQFLIYAAERGLCVRHSHPHARNFCFGKNYTEDEDRLFLIDFNLLKIYIIDTETKPDCKSYINNDIYSFASYLDRAFLDGSFEWIYSRRVMTQSKWRKIESTLSFDKLKKQLYEMSILYKKNVHDVLLNKFCRVRMPDASLPVQEEEASLPLILFSFAMI